MVEGKFGEVRRRIEENEVFVKLVVEEHLGMDEGDGESGCGGHDHGHGHGHSHSHTEQHSHSHSHIQPTPTENITESEMEKVRSTIRQCVRDWSIEVSHSPYIRSIRVTPDLTTNSSRANPNAKQATNPSSRVSNTNTPPPPFPNAVTSKSSFQAPDSVD